MGGKVEVMIIWAAVMIDLGCSRIVQRFMEYACSLCYAFPARSKPNQWLDAGRLRPLIQSRSPSLLSDYDESEMLSETREHLLKTVNWQSKRRAA